MASSWASSWGASWGSAWGAGVPVAPAVVTYGGDDAPRKKRKQKQRHLFQDIERTIHQLLCPDTEVGVDPAPVAVPVATIDDKLQELLALAQGSHALLQRVAQLRAEVADAHAADRLAREEDDEEALMWLI